MTLQYGRTASTRGSAAVIYHCKTKAGLHWCSASARSYHAQVQQAPALEKEMLGDVEVLWSRTSKGA